MLSTVKKIIPLRLFRAFQPIYHYIIAFFSALAYRFSSKNLIVVGVTGTTGKTSTVYLIAKMLAQAGYKTGFTSTAVFSNGDQEWLNDKKMTMPGRFFIQKTLRQMVKNNCRYAIIETTSEGIKQFRHRFINYDVVVFTGIYPEHLESHGNFANYQAAKGRLFAHLKKCSTKYINEEKKVCRPKTALKKIDFSRVPKTIIVNGDDEKAPYFLNFWSEVKMVYSFDPQKNEEFWKKNLASEALVKDFSVTRGEGIETSALGTKVFINHQEIDLQLLGEFNAENALAAYSVGENQKLTPIQIKTGLESVSGLAGKLEVIEAGQNFMALVDYSFEPKALEKLYQIIDLIPHHRLIHLLGSAGGGRDKARRPILGSLAGKKADLVIITNEDPYDEDPGSIIEAVASGAEEAGKTLDKDLFKILDRREAIKKALTLAEEGDLLLFTGKGAEQYICQANGQKVAWDDRQVVREEIVNKLCVDNK